MLSALLFDLDGTIANTDPIHKVVWTNLLVPHGHVVDDAFYQRHISGRLNPDIVRDLLPHLTPDQEPAFSQAKEAHFRDAARHLQPTPGLLPLLAWGRQQGLPMAVVTNAPRANAEFMLDLLQLNPWFDTVVIAADLPRGKPDPLPYQTALQQLGVGAKGAVAFEDSITGMRSAVEAGLTTVGITSTHDPADLLAVGATIAVADFTDPRLRGLGLGVADGAALV